MKAKYTCPNCGNPVLKERWEAGYEYCKESKCFEVLGRKNVALYEQPGDFVAELSPYELDEVMALFESND